MTKYVVQDPTDRILDFFERANRRQSKRLQKILKEAGATQEEIDSVDIDKQRDKEQQDFEEAKRVTNELLIDLRKQTETMLVPVKEGNIIRFETRKVTADERLQALANTAEIIKQLKSGDAQVITQ